MLSIKPVIVVFMALLALASAAQKYTGPPIETKCHKKYQVCCQAPYRCGYDKHKYLVHKVCKKQV
jgi:hypothetical protein